MLYISPCSRFELTTSVVICNECIGSYQSKYHTITATLLHNKHNTQQIIRQHIELTTIRVNKIMTLCRNSKLSQVLLIVIKWHWIKWRKIAPIIWFNLLPSLKFLLYVHIYQYLFLSLYIRLYIYIYIYIYKTYQMLTKLIIYRCSRCQGWEFRTILTFFRDNNWQIDNGDGNDFCSLYSCESNIFDQKLLFI